MRKEAFKEAFGDNSVSSSLALRTELFPINPFVIIKYETFVQRYRSQPDKFSKLLITDNIIQYTGFWIVLILSAIVLLSIIKGLPPKVQRFFPRKQKR